MPIIKRKMSKSAYVLLALIIIVPIIAVVLHVVGVWDLSFIGLGFENIMMWAAMTPFNGVILVVGVFVGGMVTFYVIKTYLIGTQVSTTTTGNYNPIGQTISNSGSQQEETVVTD